MALMSAKSARFVSSYFLIDRGPNLVHISHQLGDRQCFLSQARVADLNGPRSKLQELSRYCLTLNQVLLPISELKDRGRARFYGSDTGFIDRPNTNSLFFSYRLSTRSRPEARLITAKWIKGVSTNYDWNSRVTDSSYFMNGGVSISA